MVINRFILTHHSSNDNNMQMVINRFIKTQQEFQILQMDITRFILTLMEIII